MTEPPEPSSTYRLLEEAEPGARASIVSELMASDPEGRLRLPGEEGRRTLLNEADLRQVLTVRPDGMRLTLRRALLRGASLRQVNLEGVDLSESDLEGAHLVRANLKDAILEAANLAGCDLANVDLRGATMAEANLEGAMFEEAQLQGATLRFAKARSGFFENADLSGADLLNIDLRDAELAGASLTAAILEDANLEKANLSQANLTRANLVNASLRGALLTGADLTGASVRGASFRGATLREARLGGLDLTSCDLTGAHLSRAWLERTQMRGEQLGGAIGEERAGEFGAAKLGYLALERNFNELGDLDAARWAYLKRRRMQKRESWHETKMARARRDWPGTVRRVLAFAGDQMVEWLCDYGESVARVFLSLVVVYFGFAVLYGVTGSVVRVATDGTISTTRRPVDLAIFSLLAMTTSGSPGVGLQPRDEYVYFLSGAQALLGISMTGLLGFVLGNRIRR